jgi:hypothetical protein
MCRNGCCHLFDFYHLQTNLKKHRLCKTNIAEDVIESSKSPRFFNPSPKQGVAWGSVGGGGGGVVSGQLPRTTESRGDKNGRKINDCN